MRTLYKATQYKDNILGETTNKDESKVLMRWHIVEFNNFTKNDYYTKRYKQTH